MSKLLLLLALTLLATVTVTKLIMLGWLVKLFE